MAKDWCFLPLSSKEKVKIDRDDLERASRHTWRVTRGTTGRARVVTSIRGPDGSRHVTLGKFLMRPGKGKQVYPRRFNDELDYRKDNLLVCTLKERQRMLPKKRAKTSSVYRGVSLSKTDGKWRAAIEVNGTSLNLGHFKNEIDAAKAYNAAAAKHFGSMAYLNPIKRPKSRKND